jgi:Mn-dependent DtxR family transcriptional regulator
LPQKKFTAKQGQYLAYIYHYTKVNGVPPAEADIQRYFRVSPPSVHQMILTLEKQGLISRVPGQPRSVKVLLPSCDLPPLE